jgi:phage gp36-like protein
MTYTDVDTVRLVLSSETEETGGTAADLSDAQIQYEIDSAAAYIDSYLRVLYAVPFDVPGPVPEIIMTICTDMAALGADLNFRKSREYASQNMPIIIRYQKALQALENLKTGEQTLSSPRADTNVEGAIIIHQYPYPLFPWWEDVSECYPRW